MMSIVRSTFLHACSAAAYSPFLHEFCTLQEGKGLLEAIGKKRVLKSSFMEEYHTQVCSLTVQPKAGR